MIRFFDRAKIGDIVVFPNEGIYIDEWRDSRWVILNKIIENNFQCLEVKLVYKNNNNNVYNNLYIGITTTFRNLGNDIQLVSVKKSRLPSWF